MVQFGTSEFRLTPHIDNLEVANSFAVTNCCKWQTFSPSFWKEGPTSVHAARVTLVPTLCAFLTPLRTNVCCRRDYQSCLIYILPANMSSLWAECERVGRRKLVSTVTVCHIHVHSFRFRDQTRPHCKNIHHTSFHSTVFKKKLEWGIKVVTPRSLVDISLFPQRLQYFPPSAPLKRGSAYEAHLV